MTNTIKKEPATATTVTSSKKNLYDSNYTITSENCQGISAKKLKPCPFCGSSAEFIKVKTWGTQAYRVECLRCHAATSRVAIGTYLMFGGKNNISFTDEQAQQRAIENWNNRSGGDL